MGSLSPIIDYTGKMNPLEVNAQNIQNLIEEMNRNAQSLDAISKQLGISNPGKLVMPISGAGSSNIQSVPVGSGAAGLSFIAYVSMSDQPSNFFMLPYARTTGAPSVATIQMVASASLSTAGGQANLTFDIEVNSSYTPPVSATFYYFILNQPVGV